MFPFFASNVVPGYKPWRPLWVLAAFWALALAAPGAGTGARLRLAVAGRRAAAALLTARCCGAGGRAVRKPGLLTVLFVGLAWLPLAFALYAAQSVAYLLTGVFLLGRAPAHALFVGFFGSVLVAMVTRVTQGHSGRALVMPSVAWFAFVAIQVVALLRDRSPSSRRIRHALAGDRGARLAAGAGAVGGAIGRHLPAPRADGKPG